jgi:HPt (histidine-containing phosphotransfer) domain-containing protein
MSTVFSLEPGFIQSVPLADIHLGDAARVQAPVIIGPPPVDLSFLRSLEDVQEDGEADLVVELIDLYLKQVVEQVAIMRNALLVADMTLVGLSAHALKGSSGSIGATQMQSLCAQLEKVHDITYGLTLVNGLKQEFLRVRDVLLAERESRVR